MYLHDVHWPTPPDRIFVDPAWKAIVSAIGELPPAEQSAAWRETVIRWVNLIQSAANEFLDASGHKRSRYRVDQSPGAIILTPYAADLAAELPAMVEAFYKLVDETLGPGICQKKPWPCAILIFHSVDMAQEYLLPFRVEARKVAGVFLASGCPHVVMNSAERFSLRLTLLHELNHAALHPHPLPLWLHEGLSRYFESRLLSKANMRFSADLDLRRNKYWREAGLETFWNGDAFRDGHVLPATVLACRFVTRLLAEGRDLFGAFIQTANLNDAGASACEKVFGFKLDELAGELLGSASRHAAGKTEANLNSPLVPELGGQS